MKMLWDKKWRTLRKTGCYWAEEYATSQATQAEVKKFLLAYVIFFNALIFRNISSACAKEYLITATY